MAINFSAAIQRLKSVLRKAGDRLHSEEFHAEQLANGNYLTIGKGLGAKIVGHLKHSDTGRVHARVAYCDNGETWLIEDDGTAHKVT
jgi:hypothetical protein